MTRHCALVAMTLVTASLVAACGDETTERTGAQPPSASNRAETDSISALSAGEVFSDATLDTFDTIAPDLEGRRTGYKACTFDAPSQRLAQGGVVIVPVDCGSGFGGLVGNLSARTGEPSPLDCSVTGELQLCGQGFTLGEPNTVIEVVASQGSEEQMRDLVRATTDTLARTIDGEEAPTVDADRGGMPASDGLATCDRFGEALVRNNPTFDNRRIRSATFPSAAAPPAVEETSGRQELTCSRQLVGDGGELVGEVFEGRIVVGPDSLPPCTTPVELFGAAPAVAERAQADLVQCEQTVAGPIDRSWSVSAGARGSLGAAFTWLDLVRFDGSRLPDTE